MRLQHQPGPPWLQCARLRLLGCGLGLLIAAVFGCGEESSTPSGDGGRAGTLGSGGSSGSGALGQGGSAGVGGTAGDGGQAAGGAGGGGAGGSGATAGGAGSGGIGSGGAAGTGTGGTSTGGTGAGGSGGGGTGGSGGDCTLSVRITEIDVGEAIVANEDEAALMPLAISAKPSGGSRVAYMGANDTAYVVELDASDQLTGSKVALPGHDFGDLYADDAGGVLLVARDALGGGTNNCGTLTNLCGSTLPMTAACYDMYLVRFDGTSETWATKLTESSADLPPYSTGPTGPNVVYIWSPYAHHGRIAFDGANYAGYFGAAISVSQTCTNGGGTDGVGINIHQGDRMQVVNSSGALQSSGFGWGCSHSGYERIVWDPAAQKFVTICKTDNENRIAIAPSYTTILPVDLHYANLGDVVLGSAGGYWTTTSDIRPGQPANAPGLADVHLLHFSTGAADVNLTIASDADLNNRAAHLAAYGSGRLLAAWETSSATGDLAANDQDRKLYVQAFDGASGAPQSTAVLVEGVVGNRYQEFRAFPDGSVAYPAKGSNNTQIKIVRVLPCTP